LSFRKSEVCFNPEKIISALQNASLKLIAEERRKESERLQAVIDAMSTDTWERRRWWRAEELRHLDDLRKITNLLKSMPSKRKKHKEIDFKIRISANKLKLERMSQRQPQGDGKSIRLAAVMPVPPMISMEGGQFYTLGIGV